MKTYSIRFTGRKFGAIGAFEPIETQVFAPDPEAALLSLYDTWDHIQQPEVKEIQSPFGYESLVNCVQNTREDHQMIRLYVERLRDYLDAVAKRCTKWNQDWHDDPASEDHRLFQSSSDAQYPQEMRDAAILDLVATHLEILNYNEAAEKGGVK